MFLSDSHSDSTHSHPLLRHISTNLMKTQAHGLRVSACSDHCHYWVIHSWSCTWEDEHRTEAAVVLRARSLWFPRTRYHTAHYTHPWSRPRPPPEPSCTQTHAQNQTHRRSICMHAFDQLYLSVGIEPMTLVLLETCLNFRRWVRISWITVYTPNLYWKICQNTFKHNIPMMFCFLFGVLHLFVHRWDLWMSTSRCGQICITPPKHVCSERRRSYYSGCSVVLEMLCFVGLPKEQCLQHCSRTLNTNIGVCAAHFN